MNLRTRLILTFTLVVIICIFIAAAVLAILLQGIKNKTIVSNLESKALPIYIQFRSLVLRQTTLSDVWSNLQEQAQNSNIYIIIIDSNGNIIQQISPRKNLAKLIPLPEGLPHDENQQSTGVFSTAGGTKYFYAAYPIGQISLALAVTNRFDTLVIAAPKNTPLAIWAEIIRPFFWAGVISLLISIIIAILLARSIYKPIQQLSIAANNVAQGKFDKPVPVTGPQELKGLASNFNAMTNKVHESQEQLRQFVADTSHQLKSPLTSIQGFAQAMLDGTAVDEETRKKATQIIADESKRMIRQVNELLELSRMQAGQLKIVQEPVDIREILNQCQEIFVLRTQEKKQHWVNDIGELPAIIGDPDRLEDIFCNLFDNAIKNTPLTGEIRVRGRVSNGFVEITITDTGPGIPPEQLPFVFQRFHQSTGLRSGTGLGLAIARELILAHKGQIEVSSSPGEGATFTIKLPVSN
jgi:two-component system, OmpR family, sensor kinase